MEESNSASSHDAHKVEPAVAGRGLRIGRGDAPGQVVGLDVSPEMLISSKYLRRRRGLPGD